jgi:hypothetical protein
MSKKEWGNITWTLFHSIGESIKEDSFLVVKDTIIDLIKIICSNLPCPDCSEHAKILLQKSLINNMQSKLHLQEFLRQFHNKVNVRLNKETFTLEQVNEKYKNPRINAIISNFIIVFSKQVYNQRLLMESFHRRQSMTKIINNLKVISPHLV